MEEKTEGSKRGGRETSESVAAGCACGWDVETAWTGSSLHSTRWCFQLHCTVNGAARHPARRWSGAGEKRGE